MARVEPALDGGAQVALQLSARQPQLHRSLVSDFRQVLQPEVARALKAVRQLLPLARDAFNAGFDLNAGSGSPAAFKAAEKRFTPAVRALEKLMREMGEAIASGLPRNLYQDIAHMYRRMSAYDRADIIDWVDGMVLQLDAYGGRMSSMLDAALDNTALQRIRALLEQQGLSVLTCAGMEMGVRSELAAWVLEARRDSANG